MTHVHWHDITNFGDLMTPSVLGARGVEHALAPARESDALLCGSLIQKLTSSYSGAIVGTGLIADVRAPLPRADVRCVRGPLTAECVGRPDAPTGDLGLLCGELIDVRPDAEHGIGVVPHYVDADREAIRRLPSHVHVIDVRRRPERIVRDIASCRRIISSSLHGVITADALGVPATWAVLGDAVVGGGFKFRDHDACVRTNRRPVTDLQSLDEALGLVPDEAPPGVEAAVARIDTALTQWIQEI